MKKKILSILLAVCLLVGALPMAVSAAPLYGTVTQYSTIGGNNCQYNITGSGTANTVVTITGTVEWNADWKGNIVAIAITPPSDLTSTENVTILSDDGEECFEMEWESEYVEPVADSHAGALYFDVMPNTVDVITVKWDGTRAQTITVDSTGAALAKEPTQDPILPTQFADVPAGQFYVEAVKWAVENGITAGTDSTHFSPKKPCTRGEAVTFLWRAEGSPEPAGNIAFTDVKSGSYYEKAVRWAVEKGITSGTGNGKFSPDMTCDRSQIVTFLYRAESQPTISGENGFTDVKAGQYYENAVKWAVENGITSGTGNGKFSPTMKCDRSQIVTFLYRYSN